MLEKLSKARLRFARFYVHIFVCLFVNNMYSLKNALVLLYHVIYLKFAGCILYLQEAFHSIAINDRE